MKECPFCKGTIELRRIEHVHRWQGQMYILKNVPVEACSQCGEVFFAPETLKAMDEVTMGTRQPEEHRPVPVFSF